MAPRIGFIGSAGIMGEGMAARLLGAGHSLTVWNRDPAKSQALVDSSSGKVTAAASAKAVVDASDIVVSMLPTPEAAAEVFFKEGDGLLAGAAAGKALVDCATLQAEDMRKMSEAWSKQGGRFLEAPVSGSKGPAAQGQLVFLTAGDESLYTEATPLLDVMGKKSYFFGEVGKGTLMKLVVNKMMVEMMATLGEGMDLAGRAGLSPEDLVSVLAQGAMNNPMFSLKGPKIHAGDHAPHFPLKHARKDLLFGNALAKEVGTTTHMGSAAEQVIKASVDKDEGRLDQDFSALTLGYKTA